MRIIVLLLPAMAALLVACGTTNTPTAASSTSNSGTALPATVTGQTPASTPTVSSDTANAEILLAAGDIASCDSKGDEATAKLLETHPGTIAAVGDLAYEAGSAAEFRDCYGPSWGRFKDRTRPAPGNHEYGTAGAAPYYSYFGDAAHGPSGWYSFDLGAWHIVVLNSNCDEVGGCGPGSPEERWLRADLATSSAHCTLAYWHHPRFSSGLHGNNADMQAFWSDLAGAGAEIVLGGHDHDYERFAPMDASGQRDDAKGTREFVVGMGGRSHYPIIAAKPNSEAHDASDYGILELRLGSDSYDWNFIGAGGGSFRDSGHGICH